MKKDGQKLWVSDECMVLDAVRKVSNGPAAAVAAVCVDQSHLNRAWQHGSPIRTAALGLQQWYRLTPGQARG